MREVIMIDIANDPIQASDYKPTEDPTKFQSVKTGRGPLLNKWQDSVRITSLTLLLVLGNTGLMYAFIIRFVL